LRTNRLSPLISSHTNNTFVARIDLAREVR
jgi:hypothetical protein